MRNYPNINCEEERTKFDKDAQEAYTKKLIIKQDKANLSINEYIYDPTTQNTQEIERKGKIIAFNSFIQIVKILLENKEIVWFDYKNNTFETSRVESFMYFKMDNFTATRPDLNQLIKIFNIALSMTSLDNYSFSFWDEPEVHENIKIFRSNMIKGFGVKATFYEKDDFKELRMSLIAPRATIFDIEVGINFLSINQGYIKLFAMNEISKMIFKRIKNFFNTVHYFNEI